MNTEQDNVPEIVVEDEPVEQTPEEVKQNEAAERAKDEMSKAVQKRIGTLTRQRKEAEERAYRLESDVVALRNELQNMKSVPSVPVAAYEKSQESRVNAAESALETALGSSDPKAVVRAQKELSDAQFELRLAKMAKDSAPPAPKPQVQQKPQQQTNSEAAAWVASKDWWGVDDELTALSYAYDKRLQAVGSDPGSADHFEKIDELLRKRFPEKFKTDDEVVPPVQQQKPVTRSPVQGGPRVQGSKPTIVRLNDREKQLAKRFGLTEQEYANQKHAIDTKTNSSGYTVLGDN